MNEKLKYKINNLTKALEQLRAIGNKPLDQDHIVRDATIQRFEFSYELFWKTLKAALEEEGIITTTPKNVLQEAYKNQWLHDEKLWLDMLNDRNTTSHFYNEKAALAIYQRIKNYSAAMDSVLELLKIKFQ